MPVYLDHAATTPVLPQALEAVADAYSWWANPSSPHAAGRRAKTALEDARARVKRALDWQGDVIFTSGASEAIAIAMRQVKADAVLAGATEHDSVLRHVAPEHRLPVDRNGAVRLEGCDPAGALVAIQHVNSETGVIQPIDDLIAAVRAAEGLVLCDCAQSAGKLALPDADLVVVGGHKLGGPVGSGALLVRDLTRLRAAGGQELGYRAGTENLPAIMGLVAALEAPRPWLDEVVVLRQRLDGVITELGGEVVAREAPRIATIASYRMPGVSARAQLIRFDAAGIAVSAGSACSSGTLRTSPVLSAMGWNEAEAGEVIRVSLGWTTTGQCVEALIDQWRQIAQSAQS